MKTLVVITYYKRLESCCFLVNKLAGKEVDVVVFDDKSGDGLHRLIEGKHVKVIENPEHRGKAGFWQTYQDIFNYCRRHEYDYYMILPDDVVPCEHFIRRAISAYESIPDCICLSPLLTNRTIEIGLSRWGTRSIITHDMYYETHFFDCVGIMKRDFFEAMEWRMDPISPSADPLKSSGVGRQITLRLQAKYKKMCHVNKTLLSTTNDDSQMNQLERKLHPMYADFHDNEKCVDVYMASLWRNGHMVTTVKSLLAQPELKTITVSCNNYTDEQFAYVSEELNDPRVKLMRTNNEKCSNEKMRYMHKGTGKYVALCDDDIIYPKDHLMRLIQGCQSLNAAVSLHGGILREYPVKKYYGSSRRVFSWRVLLLKSKEVDIIANCAMLFRRDMFTKDELRSLYIKSTSVSMDDIIFSCKCKEKGIPLYVLCHKARALKHKEKEDGDNYVYDEYKENDSFQVDYINRHLTKDMLVTYRTS